MNREEPGTAKWLLRHFGASANNESVIGDLTERYRDGRSRFLVLAANYQCYRSRFMERSYGAQGVGASGGARWLDVLLVFDAPSD